MQAADGARANAAGFIILNERPIPAVLGKQVRAKGFCKKAAFVPDMTGGQELEASDIKGFRFHLLTSFEAALCH